MMVGLRSIALALVTALVLLAGCPTKVPPPDNAIEEPAELRDAIEARTDQFRNARFKEVVLEYFGRDERVKVRQLLLVERPANVRVQTRLPGSNEIVSLLVTDGETFALHRRESNRYVTGPPTSENINRLLPVDLSAADIVRVMFGGAPWDRFDAEPGDPTLEWNGQRGRYAYSVATGDGGRLVMYVRHQPYRVEQVVEYGPGEAVVYRYETDDWEPVGDQTLPSYRRFVWPERDLDFSLAVGETERGIAMPDSLFTLEPPPGSEVRRVGEGGDLSDDAAVPRKK